MKDLIVTIGGILLAVAIAAGIFAVRFKNQADNLTKKAETGIQSITSIDLDGTD